MQSLILEIPHFEPFEDEFLNDLTLKATIDQNSTFDSDSSFIESDNLSIWKLADLAWGPSSQSTSFCETLLFTYHFYFNEIDLFRIALSYFKKKEDEIDNKFEKNSDLIKIKVLIFINNWVKLYRKSIIENPKLETLLNSVIFYLKKYNKINSLNKCIEDLSNQIKNELAIINSFRQSEITPTLSYENSISAVLIGLFSSRTDLAKQLCINDHDIFSKISLHEIQRKIQGKNNFKNYSHLVENFNNLSRIITYLIIKGDRNEKRIETFELCAELAEKLIYHNNFNSAYSIFLGLIHTSLGRLNKIILNNCNFKTKNIMKNLEILYSLNNNQSSLKEICINSLTPCMPFFGAFIKDLVTFNEIVKLKENFEKNICKNLIDINGAKNINFILKFIKKCQDEKYGFKQNNLGKLIYRFQEIKEDHLYDISYRILEN